MSEEPDRAVMLSDLRDFESRLEERLEQRLTERLEQRLGDRIDANHADTRRHFNIMVERVEAAVRIVALEPSGTRPESTTVCGAAVRGTA